MSSYMTCYIRDVVLYMSYTFSTLILVLYLSYTFLLLYLSDACLMLSGLVVLTKPIIKTIKICNLTVLGKLLKSDFESSNIILALSTIQFFNL